MVVKRFYPGPRMSAASVHAGVVRLAGQVTQEPNQDATKQTARILETIDSLLEEAGSNKHQILFAQIFLADMADFSAMNVAWDAWVSRSDPPPRATVEGKLAVAGCTVEIVVTAAVLD
ncbi:MULTISPECIES: RidA family protein [unclassified Burkholderia]|uniref:RidA family protein n=1 Tax=unclassified Burkholderia TaxID=2613784 RepID=UPI000F571194|nr:MULTISPECIES: RidA family protein [unclassified Burkholderia]RQR69818.1 RidA family protein [Burkholderia sp. Bp9012]RQR73311.1 RidA family protein [Burkholderia sp. Bp9011]RQR85170.1 RidA family protein [Burkholderia sp. Bp9010]RQZ40294.1 RidA family protein [Burkholderia sp. Bp9099]